MQFKNQKNIWNEALYKCWPLRYPAWQLRYSFNIQDHRCWRQSMSIGRFLCLSIQEKNGGLSFALVEWMLLLPRRARWRNYRGNLQHKPPTRCDIFAQEHVVFWPSWWCHLLYMPRSNVTLWTTMARFYAFVLMVFVLERHKYGELHCSQRKLWSEKTIKRLTLACRSLWQRYKSLPRLSWWQFIALCLLQSWLSSHTRKL